MKTTKDGIKISKAAQAAIRLLERRGLEVVVSRPGARNYYLIREKPDGKEICAWYGTPELLAFAKGFSFGEMLGIK